MIILTYALINIFFNIKFSSKNEWLESAIFPFDSIADDEDVKNDNLNLLIVPQHERNPDSTG